MSTHVRVDVTKSVPKNNDPFYDISLAMSEEFIKDAIDLHGKYGFSRIIGESILESILESIEDAK